MTIFDYDTKFSKKSVSKLLTGSAVPYGYYFNAFLESLLRCERLLIVGYGGGDEHLNTWIEEYVKIHGSRRRTGCISLCHGNDVGENVPYREIMQLLADAEYFNDSFAYCDEKLSEFQRHGYLGLCTRGFPLNSEESMEMLIAFLNSSTLKPTRFKP